MEDLLTAVGFLASRADVDATQVEVFAEGAAGPPALHAAAFEQRIANLTVTGSITSWIDVIRMPLSKKLTNVVPFALEYYDLPHLVEAIAPRRVTRTEPG